MIENIITAAIVLVAAFGLYRWFKGTAKGERGCSCGGCGKDCASRQVAPPVSGAKEKA